MGTVVFSTKFGNMIMNQLVTLQSISPREGFWTQSALEWPFTCVTSLVDGKVAYVEVLGAIVASGFDLSISSASFQLLIVAMQIYEFLRSNAFPRNKT